MIIMYEQGCNSLSNVSRSYFLPLKQSMVLLYFLENGRILADINTPDQNLSFQMRFKNSSV